MHNHTHIISLYQNDRIRADDHAMIGTILMSVLTPAVLWNRAHILNRKSILHSPLASLSPIYRLQLSWAVRVWGAVSVSLPIMDVPLLATHPQSLKFQ